ISVMLPSLSAVLAGAVFGDHCSPISDTTILSSAGAGCRHIDHFITQLPYTLIAAFISTLAYIVLGFTNSVILSWSLMLLCFILLILWLYFLNIRRIDGQN